MHNLQFQRFGRLIVICSTKKRGKWGNIIWLCRCDCGNLTTVISTYLVGGDTKSCGCLHKEEKNFGFNFKHGDDYSGKKARLYNIWAVMKKRCLNPTDPAYKWYGKKGIKICKEWKNNYPAFKFWALLNGYEEHLTIDRIDHNGNYEPNNCQWITRAENARKAARDRKKRILNFGEHVSKGRP